MRRVGVVVVAHSLDNIAQVVAALARTLYERNPRKVRHYTHTKTQMAIQRRIAQ